VSGMKDKSGTASLRNFNLRNFMAQDTGLTRLLVILIVVILVFSILNPKIFLTKDYIVSMLYLFPEFGILALGMMLCMISGGIDLSVVSIANFSGILCCIILTRMVGPEASSGGAAAVLLLAVIVSMIFGALCGLLNGFLIAKLGIPPILATLGGQDLVMGLAIALTRGSSISNLPPILSNVGTYYIFGFIPVTLVVFILCAVIVAWQLEKTSFGYKLYLLGSNPKASRYSGVNNDRILMRTYVMSGVLAALAGILMCARFNSARAEVGTSYTMQAILICVLGGVNPNGGFGTVRGVAVSVLILQVLSSGFNMFPFLSNFYRDLIWGTVLILVMAYNYISNQRREKKERETIAGSHSDKNNKIEEGS